MNRDLIEEASNLIDQINEGGRVDFVWVPRAQNEDADRLANQVSRDRSFIHPRVIGYTKTFQTQSSKNKDNGSHHFGNCVSDAVRENEPVCNGDTFDRRGSNSVRTEYLVIHKCTHQRLVKNN
ncbi:hypothetical protein C8R45DRAFT_995838 [Mycena sanguinolenta]|nr:hypothetical protein C8R45DRAFT_995838 [Mycena sanguinolenta]